MKVLVVDDEHLINQYIVQCIRDADCGDQVIGAANSGIKALTILEETSADLAFVDITMPKMDGLDLLREIKAKYPSTSVIMLTCHDDFEYARAAMQNNADNYILKSELTPEYMKKILEDVRNARKKKGVDQLTRQLKQRDYIKKIVAGGSDVYVITEEDLRRNNILLRDDAAVALCFRNTGHNLDTVVSASGADFENPLIYAYNENLTILLLNIRHTKKKWDTFGELFREVDHYFECLEPQLDGKIGYSRVFFRMARLRVAITEALESLNDKFYGNSVSCEGSYSERAEKLRKLMMHATIRMEEGNLRTSCKILQEAIRFAEGQHPDAATMKETMLQICQAVHVQYQVRLDGCEEKFRSVEYFGDFKKNVLSLIELFASLDKKYSHAIQQAVDFIDQHFTEDLTLNTVSDHVFLNREYLSRQFKKEVGMNFSEYLTALRLKRAKELLETTNLRISEVAMQIGIPNISYFSTIFRKEFNCSPTDVRARKGTENA